ncbi:MAG: hypothetical protein ACLQGT_05050 [Terracidiphilus sp.]
MPGTNGGPNLTRRLIDINGDAGAYVTINATGPTRAWRIQESIVKGADGSAVTPQGFTVLIPNDGTAAPGFNQVFARPAALIADEPGEFPYFENWNHVAEHGPVGEVMGGPGNANSGSGIGATTATPLCKVRSLTATPTTIEIVEYF